MGELTQISLKQISLIIVIVIVIFIIGDAFKSVLLKRKESILLNLKEAEIRADNAQKLFINAKNKLEEAINKTKEIDLETKILVQNEKIKYKNEINNNIKQLKKLKELTISFKKQKVQNQISKEIIILTLENIKQKLQIRCDKNFQNSINNFYITLFRKLKLDK
uniref:ATP synthase subunit b, chloroplastic n=1 Tax=Dichotomosiphon tuberosus TaxID=118263 RepID=A0A386AWX8_9CHLO|nr:ATP synthase CF0 subunit I [Dichotomosiphon tuberosus]